LGDDGLRFNEWLGVVLLVLAFGTAFTFSTTTSPAFCISGAGACSTTKISTTDAGHVMDYATRFAAGWTGVAVPRPRMQVPARLPMTRQQLVSLPIHNVPTDGHVGSAESPPTLSDRHGGRRRAYT
jgi:hypothetical protein